MIFNMMIQNAIGSLLNYGESSREVSFRRFKIISLTIKDLVISTLDLR